MDEVEMEVIRQRMSHINVTTIVIGNSTNNATTKMTTTELTYQISTCHVLFPYTSVYIVMLHSRCTVLRDLVSCLFTIFVWHLHDDLFNVTKTIFPLFRYRHIVGR